MCAFVSCHGARHSGFQLRSPHCWTDVKQRMLSTANKTFTCRTRWMITGFAVYIQEFSDQCHRQMYSPQDQNRPPQPAMDGYYTQAITTEKKKRLLTRAQKTNNWSAYWFHQKECWHKMRQAEQDYINTMIEDGLRNNKKPFWHSIKARNQANISVALLREKGHLYSDSKNKVHTPINQIK